jgi:pyrroloquinoline-quinone synthase
MDAERITRALERALEGRRLLDHPFYQRWSAGALSREGLSAYAAQYRHFEASLPEWLRTIAATATEPELREQALRNLEDEAGALPTHVDLFERFAAALGAPRTGPTPAMAALLKTYRDATVRGAADGFAAVLAYEAQAPAVAETKAAGLRLRDTVPESAIAFWDLHATVDVDHAQWAVQALARTAADDESLTAAMREAAAAWWAFLDEREAMAA